MAHQHEPTPVGASPRVTRRTLAKGAAWTTPVLLVGAVSPAQAASGPTNPCQCLDGYNSDIFGGQSKWTKSVNTYTLTMLVTNFGCGLLSGFFSTANATDNSAQYAAIYTDNTTAQVTGSTSSGSLLVGGAISGTLTVPSGKTLKSFCVTIDVTYKPWLGASSKCPLVLCWTVNSDGTLSVSR